MASLINVDPTELTGNRTGYNGVSLSTYVDGNEPTATGYLEMAGSLYLLSTDDLDSAGDFGGIGASTLFYSYLDPTGLACYITTSAPVFSTSKNGYYHSVDTTHRCFAQFFKSSTNTWTQHTVIKGYSIGDTGTGTNLGIGANADRSIRFASDAKMYWDESENEIFTDVGIGTYHSQDGGADIQIFTYTGSGNSSDFTIKKPISCLFETSCASNASLYLKINGSYAVFPFVLFLSGLQRSTCLNPGTYRITNGSAGTSTIYAVGTYGAPTVTLSEIVV